MIMVAVVIPVKTAVVMRAALKIVVKIVVMRGAVEMRVMQVGAQAMV